MDFTRNVSMTLYTSMDFTCNVQHDIIYRKEERREKVQLKDWKKKTFKFISIFEILISITVIILAFIQIIGVWDNAIYVYEPLVGVLMIIQTIEYWKKSKSTAYISLIAAVFIFAVTISILFFKL